MSNEKSRRIYEAINKNRVSSERCEKQVTRKIQDRWEKRASGGYVRRFEIESSNSRAQNVAQNAGKRFRAPKIVTFGRWYRFSSGRKSHCTLCWMGSESTTRPLSLSLFLSLVRSICPCVRLHHTFTVSSSLLSLSRSLPATRRKNAAGKRKREKERMGGRPGRGLEKGLQEKVWESLHASGSTSARVITRSEGERAPSHACTHFSCADTRGSAPRVSYAPILEGEARSCAAREPLVETRVYARRNPRRVPVRARTSILFLYVRRT